MSPFIDNFGGQLTQLISLQGTIELILKKQENEVLAVFPSELHHQVIVSYPHLDPHTR
jgi:hypothetical protein